MGPWKEIAPKGMSLTTINTPYLPDQPDHRMQPIPDQTTINCIFFFSAVLPRHLKMLGFEPVQDYASALEFILD